MSFFGEIYSEYKKKIKNLFCFCVCGKSLIINGLFLNYNFHSVK